VKVLVAHNFHRHGGGSDDSVTASAQLLRDHGNEVRAFTVDSSDISPGLRGRVRAFGTGFYSRTSVRSLRAALDEFQPEVVHVHEVYPLLSPWILPACRDAGVPVVMTCHDFRLTCPIVTHYTNGHVCTACLDHNELWCCFNNCRGNLAESVAFAGRSAVARKTNVVLRNVDVFITASEFARRWLIDHVEIAPEQIDAVPYAIPVAAEAADPSSGGYVAFAGRFVREKGIDVVIDACRRADLPLRLAGDQTTMPDLEVSGDVHFTGLLDAPALAAFYRGARILVVPSTWFETFGIVAGEAMGHGVPVVASRIGALAEVVDDGVTGLHFETGDSRDLAVKLRALWDDPERCDEMGRAGRAKVARAFSLESHYQGLMGAYAKAIDGRRRARV
jgi:glycosyltransferase involved in cell wall biosynthesis